MPPPSGWRAVDDELKPVIATGPPTPASATAGASASPPAMPTAPASRSRIDDVDRRVTRRTRAAVRNICLPPIQRHEVPGDTLVLVDPSTVQLAPPCLQGDHGPCSRPSNRSTQTACEQIEESSTVQFRIRAETLLVGGGLSVRWLGLLPFKGVPGKATSRRSWTMVANSCRESAVQLGFCPHCDARWTGGDHSDRTHCKEASVIDQASRPRFGRC